MADQKASGDPQVGQIKICITDEDRGMMPKKNLDHEMKLKPITPTPNNGQY